MVSHCRDGSGRCRSRPGARCLLRLRVWTHWGSPNVGVGPEDLGPSYSESHTCTICIFRRDGYPLKPSARSSTRGAERRGGCISLDIGSIHRQKSRNRVRRLDRSRRLVASNSRWPSVYGSLHFDNVPDIRVLCRDPVRDQFPAGRGHFHGPTTRCGRPIFYVAPNVLSHFRIMWMRMR